MSLRAMYFDPDPFPAAADGSVGTIRCVEVHNIDADASDSPSTRARTARRALDYMRGRLDATFSVGERCRVIGTSRRTLQTSFQEAFGVNPCVMLRMLRLEHLHRDLWRGLPERETIADAAARYGLWHPSRMAAEYRALYGELPPATLARGRRLRTRSIDETGLIAAA